MRKHPSAPAPSSTPEGTAPLGRRRPWWHAASVLALVVSCGLQEQGERCDPDNFSLDCESGLVCRPGAELGFEGDLGDTALCCPEDPAAITVDECRAGEGLPAETPVGDAGSRPTPTPAPTDAGQPPASDPASAPDAAVADAGPGDAG